MLQLVPYPGHILLDELIYMGVVPCHKDGGQLDTCQFQCSKAEEGDRLID